jgi:formylglycine-generating enzyme required for sulfatase activity
VPGADWQHPFGPKSSLEGRKQYPVVHIAYEDAAAYAEWRNASLPSEAQFEYAAKGGGRKSIDGAWTANTWQGTFPVRDTATDGYAGLAPVGCFAPNKHGLYDMIGNVWEWTRSGYTPSHRKQAGNERPEESSTEQTNAPAKVIKGGSFLCAPNYCSRYRPEARQPQDPGLGTSHIGFRIVLNASKKGNRK